MALETIINLFTAYHRTAAVLLCNSTLALIAALLVSGSFAEEPWCREHLGAAYEEYSKKVPRFFGLRRRRTEAQL